MVWEVVSQGWLLKASRTQLDVYWKSGTLQAATKLGGITMVGAGVTDTLGQGRAKDT